jgi:hypothetical protein
MKTSTGREILNPFIEQAEKDKDSYLIVHFSDEEDKYVGYHNHMDLFDAVIVIKDLIKSHNIPVNLLAMMLNSEIEPERNPHRGRLKNFHSDVNEMMIEEPTLERSVARKAK